LADAALALDAEKPIVLGHSYGGRLPWLGRCYRSENIAAIIPLAAASNPWEGPLPTLYRINADPIIGAIFAPLLTSFVPPSYIASDIAEVFQPQADPESYADHVGAALSLRRVSLRANARQRANILDEIRTLQPSTARLACRRKSCTATPMTRWGSKSIRWNWPIKSLAPC